MAFSKTAEFILGAGCFSISGKRAVSEKTKKKGQFQKDVFINVAQLLLIHIQEILN